MIKVLNDQKISSAKHKPCSNPTQASQIWSILHSTFNHQKAKTPSALFHLEEQDETKLEKINPELVSVFLNSPQGHQYANLVAVGNAQKTVTLKALAKFPLPIPTIEEQKKIVGIVNDFDISLFSSEEYLRSLLKVKQGLMQDLLTGRVRVLP